MHGLSFDLDGKVFAITYHCKLGEGTVFRHTVFFPCRN
jgi:hypothetical protein